MSDELTKQCVKELTDYLGSLQPQYSWTNEHRIEVGRAYTQIDIFGRERHMTAGEQIILIQFEMHRGHPGDNAVKAMELLAGNARLSDKRALILHVFSPWYEAPIVPQVAGGTTPRNAEMELQREAWDRTVRRASARQSWHEEKVRLKYAASTGWPNCQCRTYRVVEWDVQDAKLRSAIMDLSLSNQKQIQLEMAKLAGQISNEISQWLSKLGHQ